MVPSLRPVAFGLVLTGPRQGHAVPPRLGGIAALVVPVALVLVAIDVGFTSTDDVAGGFLASLAFLLAAPTAWIFSIRFIEAGRLIIVMFGLLTSLPLWYLLGRWLAARSASWTAFAGRYLSSLVVWITFNFLVLAIVDAFTA